ncbi:MAG: TonB-dependent receptor [Oceanococcus sp.]
MLVSSALWAESDSELSRAVVILSEEAQPSLSDKPAALDQIIVVAQRREQAELDVPISISVINSDFMAEHGMVDLADISVHVPNARFNNSAIFPDYRIRGFGTAAVNPVFEQSVGLVIDGVPYASKFFYMGALFDLRQVEIMRGPQGALYGKNTTAGLINLVSQRPSHKRELKVDLQFGNLDRRRYELAVGGPLADGLLNARLAVVDDRRGGFIENTLALTDPNIDQEPGERSRQAQRLQLAFPDLWGSELLIGYTHSESALVGATEFKNVPEHTRAYVERFDPNVDFEPFNLRGGVDNDYGADFEVDSFNLEWRIPWGSWQHTLVAAHSNLDVLTATDADFSPVPVTFVDSGRNQGQQHYEWRTTSKDLPGLLGLADFGQSSILTVGALLQRMKVGDLFSTTNINDVLLAEFLAVEQSDGNVPIFDPLLPLLPTDLETSDAASPLAQESSTLFYDESARTTALYTQLDWQILRRWALGAGLRWSRERKGADISRQYDTTNALVFSQVLMWQEFDRQVRRDSTHLTPKLSINFKPTAHASLFASWSTAYKSGGFNAFASTGDDETLLYDPEEVSQLALDGKFRLLDGRARVNVSIFRMDLEDFQVFTIDPVNFAASTKNAASSRSQGVEADIYWQAAPSLSVVSSVGFNDTEFLDFKIGTCPQDMTNSDGDDDERCDLSGKPMVRAPRWTATLGASYRRRLSALPGLHVGSGTWLDRWALTAGISGEYSSTQYLSDDLDERKRQQPFTRVNAHFGVASSDQRWSLRLLVNNLNDVRTAYANGEVPAVAPEHFFQLPEAGRSWFLNLRYAVKS